MTVDTENRYTAFRGELVDAGVLVGSPVDGLYGKGASFVAVFDGLDRFVRGGRGVRCSGGLPLPAARPPGPFPADRLPAVVPRPHRIDAQLRRWRRRARRAAADGRGRSGLGRSPLDDRAHVAAGRVLSAVPAGRRATCPRAAGPSTCSAAASATSRPTTRRG